MVLVVFFLAMADQLNWGILATGGIARQFAAGLKVSKTGTLVAVGSRSQESADSFCEKFGGKGYDSYEAVLADPTVEAVYIALPHHLHMEWTIKCAEAGKAILCEKPFTLNALEAEKALDAVKKADVFFMEAFMYRCAPQTRKLVELLEAGVIGQIVQINAEFGFRVCEDWTNFRAFGALGGGGLMDVGSYCVSLCRMVAGAEPEKVAYSAIFTDRGADGSGSASMLFPGGITAHFGTGVHVNLMNDARIYGIEGRIEIDNPWKTSIGAKMRVVKGDDVQEFDLGVSNDELYAAEADAVAAFIEKKECPYVTLQDTMQQMRTLDRLRESAGLVFDEEMKA
ncbi:Gfo/Idh/MocA family oxidoreductase [soil metagenome]